MVLTIPEWGKTDWSPGTLMFELYLNDRVIGFTIAGSAKDARIGKGKNDLSKELFDEWRLEGAELKEIGWVNIDWEGNKCNGGWYWKTSCCSRKSSLSHSGMKRMGII